MLIYLLKSSACLAIFMLFYKLILEKTSAHKFKRFYLLSVLGLAFVIPLITITEYIEPVVNDFKMITTTNNIEVNNGIILEGSINYLPILIGVIYSLGLLFFLIKFSINLNHIISKIKQNPRYKTASFINVLIENLVVPHTFLNYIFFNKTKFENNDIPSEVIIHERAHAKQKHSIDIILLELLQIIFWFNPLIYLIKKDIKLNHEFLADSEVLKQGVSASIYQNTILAFSSKATNHQLANAINYSSIKKRFTVMKTQTSKTSVWLRSLLLLPLIAITLFSFSEKIEVEKEDTKELILQNPSEDSTNDKDTYYQNAEFLFKNKEGEIISKKRYSELTQEEKDRLFLPIGNIKKKSPTQSDLDRWKDSKTYGIWYDNKKINNNSLNEFKPSSISLFYESKLEKNAINYGEYFNQVNLYSDIYFNEHHKNDKAYSSKSFVVTIIQDEAKKGATKQQLDEYNRLAKHYNNQPKEKRIIKKKDLERLEALYKLMSDEQKKKVQPFPECPPPPPPPPPPPAKENDVKTGFIKINGTPHYFVNINNHKKYYNKKGYEVSKTGKVLSKSQVNASDVIPGQYVARVYTDGKVVVQFKENKPSLNGESNIPLPPKEPKRIVLREEKAPKPVKVKTTKSPKVTKDNLPKETSKVKSKEYQLTKIEDIKTKLNTCKSKLSFVTEISKDMSLRFCYNGKTITRDRAVRITKNNPNLYIRLGIEHNTGQNIIYLSKSKPLIGYKG